MTTASVECSSRIIRIRRGPLDERVGALGVPELAHHRGWLAGASGGLWNPDAPATCSTGLCVARPEVGAQCARMSSKKRVIAS